MRTKSSESKRDLRWRRSSLIRRLADPRPWKNTVRYGTDGVREKHMVECPSVSGRWYWNGIGVELVNIGV